MHSPNTGVLRQLVWWYWVATQYLDIYLDNMLLHPVVARTSGLNKGVRSCDKLG